MKDKYIRGNCVGYSKMRTIDVDEFIKIKFFKDELDSTLNLNEPTDELFVAKDITEEASLNPDRLNEEIIGNLEYVKNQQDKFNEKTEETVNNEETTKAAH